MSLQRSYSLLAPAYDRVVEATSRRARQQSIQCLPLHSAQQVLIPGIGTGLDIPYLPSGPHYLGLDLTANMLERARVRARGTSIDLDLGIADAQQLPCPDQSFDVAILHLILAVVPEPHSMLTDVIRVLKPGASISIVDKFLRPQQRAPVRRLLNHLSRHVATRMDVVFETLLEQTPQVRLISDRPLLAGGWFRHILLEKR